MTPLLYDELVDFYHLLDPLEDHADEAAEYGGALCSAVRGARSLLELGAGAGHGAHFVKTHFEEVMLTDLSAPMQALSVRLNPDCAHALGDMRSLRLGRSFDCVLCHDAICYMQSEADLRAAFQTAFEHLRPGGAALFVPDCIQDTFVESHEVHVGEDDQRGLRCLTWSHDPDPGDDTYVYDFALLLREGRDVRAVHDRHVCGLFSQATWLGLATEVGFDAQPVSRALPEASAASGYAEVMFLLQRS